MNKTEGQLSRLKSDMVVLQIIDIDTKSEDQAIRTEMELNCVQLLRMFLELSPPRLFNTCDRATNWLKTVNVTTNGLIEDFQRQREIILNERRRIEDECEEAEYSLCGWVEP